MVVGDLKIYALESLQGDIAYVTSVTPLKLGGLSNPNRGTITLSIPRPSEKKPRRILLEIGLHTIDYPDRMRWRLWFDGIAVSREYRPKSIARLPDTEGFYSKTVFDVTPIYQTADVHKVTIAYEGSNPIVVEHVGLLAIYDIPDAQVSFAFLSGALALNPRSTYTIDIKLPSVPRDATDITLRAVLGFQQKDSEVLIEANGVSRRLGGLIGVEEATLEQLPASDTYRVVIRHEKGSKHVRVSTLVLTVAKRLLPDIRAEVVEKSRDRLLVRLVNTGRSKPEKLTVLLISPGAGITRVEVKPLEPGESTLIELPASEGKRATLRIVWRKHGKPYQRDYKL